MLNPNIPLYDPTQPAQTWESYASTNFTGDSMKDIHLAALKYNVKQLIAPISLEQIAKWSDICFKLNDLPGWGVTVGGIYRQIFELSDHSIEAQTALNKKCLLPPKDFLDFVYTPNADYQIFDRFSSIMLHDIISVLHDEDRIADHTISNPKTYLWTYVYSKDFTNKVQTVLNNKNSSDKYMFQAKYLSETHKLVKKIDNVLSNYLNNEERRLELLLSILCTTRLIENSGNQVLSVYSKQNIHDILNIVDRKLEQHFLDKHKEFQTLRSLGVVPSVSDILSLNATIKNLDIPGMEL